MKYIGIILLTIISMTCNAQVAGNFKQVRLLNNTDSISLGSTTGIIRYDPATAKYRFFNALTSTWFSYSNGAFWPLAGSASLTGSVNMDLDGNEVTILDLPVSGPYTSFNVGSGTIAGVVGDVSSDEQSAFNVSSGEVSLASTSADGLTQSSFTINPSGGSFVGLTEDATVTKIVGLTASDEIRWIDPADLGTSLTSTYVGYGSGSNTVTGESSFTYDASSELLTVSGVETDNISALSSDLGLNAPSGNITLTLSGAATITSASVNASITSSFRIENTSSTTTSVVRPLIIDTQSTGAPNIGFGSGISFASELSGGQPFVMGSVDFAMTNATFGSEDSDFIVRTAIDGTLSNQFRVRSSGIVQLPTTPTNNNAATDLLVRNSSTGNIEYRAASSLSSSPAGSDTQVQFNNSGAFGADADLTFTGGNTLNATNLTISQGAVTSGTYTPTATALDNITAITISRCQYMRVGDVVTVSGQITSITTSATAVTRFQIPLPIASNFVSASSLAGTASGIDGVLGTMAIEGNSTVARFAGNNAGPGTFNAGVSFIFTYRIE